MSRSDHLVIGIDGRIGSALARRLRAAGAGVVGTTRRPDRRGEVPRRLDLSADPRTWDLPERCSVAYLLAAVTALAACEADPEGTRAANVEGTLACARLLAARGAHVVFLSTNLVLAGDRPWAGTDAPLRPQSRYAAQKAEVEQALLAEGLPASILRITKIAETLEPLLDGWAESLAGGRPLTPFSDLVCAPLPLASVLDAMIALGERRAVGVHHLSGDRDMGYDAICRALADRLGADRGLVRPTTSAEAGVTLQARPAHTTLAAGPTDAAAPVDSLRALRALLEGVADRHRRAG